MEDKELDSFLMSYICSETRSELARGVLYFEMFFILESSATSLRFDIFSIELNFPRMHYVCYLECSLSARV